MTRTSSHGPEGVRTPPYRRAVPPSFSVVIPAHNEAGVIERCLAFVEHLDPGEAEVIVVANGCTDATVDRAGTVEGVRVVDLPQGGKAGALDAGDAVATAFPRIYLDADIIIDHHALRRVAEALPDDVARVAAPRARYVTDGRPWVVRAFYTAFQQTPYARDGLTGLGVYALSRAGRQRFDTFPPILADDLFVQRLFADHERVVVDAVFDIETPRSFRDLAAVRTRIAHSNTQLAAWAADRDDEARFCRTTADTGRALTRVVARRPALLPAVGVYAAVTVDTRRRARSADDVRWLRDESTR